MVWHMAAAITLHFGAFAFAAALLGDCRGTALRQVGCRIRHSMAADIVLGIVVSHGLPIFSWAHQDRARKVCAGRTHPPFHGGSVAAEEQQFAAAQKKLQSSGGGGRRHSKNSSYSPLHIETIDAFLFHHVCV